MKYNEFGNPVNYDDIYMTGNGGYTKVYIEVGNPLAVQAVISSLFEKEILSRNAEIVFEIADAEGFQTEVLVSALKQCPLEIGVTVRLFLHGFSKYSYEKSGLCDFERDRRAIEEICRKLSEGERGADKTAGRSIKTEIQYLLYQFNMMDVRKAAAFAENLGASFCCVYASFPSDKKKRRYLALEMPVEEMIHEAEGYFFTYLDDLEDREALYKEFRGPQTVRVNKEGHICLEWYDESADRELPLESVKEVSDLDRAFRDNFGRAAAVRYSGDVWLWNKMAQANRNYLFRIGVK